MKDESNKFIGNLIRTTREQKGLSQQEIADYVGVSKSGVSRWESGEVGNIGRIKIKLLSEILNISPIAIVMGKDYKEIGVEDQSTTPELQEYFKNNSHKLSSLPQNKKDNLIKMIELYLD